MRLILKSHHFFNSFSECSSYLSVRHENALHSRLTINEFSGWRDKLRWFMSALKFYVCLESMNDTICFRWKWKIIETDSLSGENRLLLKLSVVHRRVNECITMETCFHCNWIASDRTENHDKVLRFVKVSVSGGTECFSPEPMVYLLLLFLCFIINPWIRTYVIFSSYMY